MAEGFNEKSPTDTGKNSSEPEDSDNDDSMRPDLGVDNIRDIDKKTQNHEKGINEVPKREENPFSFKHFLNRDNSSYQHQGARPKIYTHQPQIDVTNQPRITSEFSSALPDFVQDHLVIEQCYLGNDASPKDLAVDLDNLPDFTPDKSNQSRWKDNSRNNERINSNTSNIPLDLPVRPRVEFPLDLPLTESQINNRNGQHPVEVGVSKSLPDFLSDGAALQPDDSNQIGQSPERESDRLRRELEFCRRQLAETNRRTENLQRQLDHSKEREREYTQNLAKALEQVEENLNISNRRATSAENQVTKLKQEIRRLMAEVISLRNENTQLRGEEGAAGGPSYVHNDVDTVQQVQQLSQALRASAGAAEMSLRKLLGGVDNLRMVATALENIYHIEDRNESFASDPSEDSGPAL